MTSPGDRKVAYAAWIAVCLIWGTTYLAIKICLETIPPALMGGIRNLCLGATDEVSAGVGQVGNQLRVGGTAMRMRARG